MASVVYWIHSLEHTDIFTEGYVGITNNLNARLRNHKSKKCNEHLKNAITKYGWENLIKEVILVAEETYCLMIESTLRFKKNIGWNIAEGGSKPPINRWNKGKPIHPNALAGMKKANTGSKHTKAHIEKISKGLIGRPMSEKNKKIFRILTINREQPMKGKKFPKIKCPHCNKEGGLSGMKSWHFDNCKFKEVI